MRIHRYFALVVLSVVHAACAGSGDSGTAAGGQDLSAPGGSAPAKSAAPAASGAAANKPAAAGGKSVGPTVAGGPYSARSGDEVDVIDFGTQEATAFDLTPTDPQTGLIVGAHPSPFSVQWTTVSDGKVFGVNNTTGEVDKDPCGDVVIHPGAELLVSPDNTCGLGQEYVAAPYKNAARDKVIDLVADGLSITEVDPTTGIIAAAHPDNYNVNWTGPMAGDLTGEGEPASCGKVTFDPTKKALTLTGCEADGTYAQ